MQLVEDIVEIIWSSEFVHLYAVNVLHLDVGSP